MGKDDRLIEAMRKAKTGREMLESWDECLPEAPKRTEARMPVWGAYVEKKPELFEDFLNTPLLHALERGILDPKTRELVLVGILAARESYGMILHAEMALERGATVDEIMEVIFLSAYEAGKAHLANIGPSAVEFLKRAEEFAAKAK